MAAVSMALAAAAGFSLPHANVTLADYIHRHAPSSVDERGIWAVAEVEVFVDPEGKILECSPKRVTGDVALAGTLCSISIGQKLTPPHDFYGRPVHAASRLIFTAFPDHDNNPSGALGHIENDTLQISVRPGGRDWASVPLVNLHLLIDAKGSVASCAVITDVSTDIKSVACQQASAQPFPARIGEAKQPVPYIRSLVVQFMPE